MAELTPGSEADLVAAMGAEGGLVGERLARGCRAFAAWRGGRVAAYGWLTAGPEWIGEIGREIRPAPGAAYVWNCVTLEPHRRQGLFRALLASIRGAARDRGLLRLWIGGLAGTAESAVAAAGFLPVLHIDAAGEGRFTVSPAEAAAPELVAAGRQALGVEPGAGFAAGPSRRH